MAQKTKVKELVGRGLNSYHTKALQQMDRIKKKNKEQNHKISILSNELDNDYLTKTEEGSVISLEHSKEGMVYLDELQGNTLVNYCVDGSKELTLNGDIDVEGTFVTTTEGVDNGKVDVMCEGNTLVNKLYKIKDYGSITEFRNHGWGSTSNCPNYEWIDNGIKIKALSSDTQLDRYYRSSPDKYGIFKKNRTYIVRMNVNSNNLQQNATILRCFYGNGTTFMTGQMSEVVNGVFIKKATTSSTIEEVDAIHSMISLDYRTPQGVDGWVSFQNVMVIDVTDLPSYQQDVEYWRNIEYFEGMKSVGQDDENGHKIEILSQNNLIQSDFRQWTKYSGEYQISEDGREFTVSYGDTWNAGLRIHNVTLKKGTYYLGYTSNNMSSATIFVGSKEIRVSQNRIFTIEEDVVNATFAFRNGSYNGSYTIRDIYITKDVDLGFSITKSNKKEILINEPLRATENYKDKFVKINGKWFIERNCDVEVLDGTNPYWYTFQNNEQSIKAFVLNGFTQRKRSEPFVIENYPCINSSVWSARTGAGLYNGTGDQCGLAINESDLTSLDDAGVKEYLSRKPIRLVYAKDIPTYEPLQIEPTLNTYNDVTHISNNSIIPCNMKIKNSGYNAIIKPSTLYTVALDTNKSGTIGINLGGAKVTTTNNVATVTTPATLTDDSLRLYGKGIKGSKVRLLEGDKTNWIPSHFEGMKSSFEDKVQEDGSYKMEILSNNKNLFDIDAEYYKAGWGNQNYQRNGNGFSFDAMNGWNSIGYEVKGHRDKTVVVSATVTCVNKDTSKLREQSLRVHTETWSGANGTSFLDGETKRIKFNVKLNHEGRVYFNGSSTPEGSNNGGVKWTVKDILIEDVDGGTGYFPRECNKIQFSSIEPLRRYKNSADKFVFKDNKLMIERNCAIKIFNGSENWNYSSWTNNNGKINRFSLVANVPSYSYQISNKYKYIWGDYPDTYYRTDNGTLFVYTQTNKTLDEFKQELKENNLILLGETTEPTYEEVPFELQKIILEGYENGTLFFDTNIPPTTTVRYAGETPIVKATKLNKTEVLNNTEDINDNIIPYLMDMDYRVVMLQLATEELEGGVSMARLFGGTYEMIKRDILSKRLTREEYGYRLADYYNAGKLTEEQVRELEELR